MQPTTSSSDDTIGVIAARHGFSADAARSMLQAISRGNGTMAQFDHPEFSGAGQWMRGGMTMISDMFNAPLKTRIVALCNDLANALEQRSLTADRRAVAHSSTERAAAAQGHGDWGSTKNWWPAELGLPDSTGAQNDARYAYFSNARRLAIALDGKVTVYDTLDHRISGFSQQQSIGGSMSFASQHGPIDVASLPVVRYPGE